MIWNTSTLTNYAIFSQHEDIALTLACEFYNKAFSTMILSKPEGICEHLNESNITSMMAPSSTAT